MNNLLLELSMKCGDNKQWSKIKSPNENYKTGAEHGPLQKLSWF